MAFVVVDQMGESDYLDHSSFEVLGSHRGGVVLTEAENVVIGGSRMKRAVHHVSHEVTHFFGFMDWFKEHGRSDRTPNLMNHNTPLANSLNNHQAFIGIRHLAGRFEKAWERSEYRIIPNKKGTEYEIKSRLDKPGVRYQDDKLD